MAPVLSLFGPPTITVGDNSRVLGFERRTQLLVFLALRRTWVGRAELSTLLWPDQDSKLALTNLRKALHRLQSMSGAEAMEARGSALRFEARTDVDAFESALREQRVADAIARYRGDLLHGFEDNANEAWSGWLGFERDRLRTDWRAAVQQHLLGQVKPVAAIDLAARLLESDPLDESALRLYVQWLDRAGQAARARQACRDFVKRLQDELGLAPSAELVALQAAIGSAPRAMAGGVATPTVAADDGFVGRTVELRRIAALLSQDDCRLLCLTGPGGVGKTRLAQRVLHELAGHFADGATFVPLDDLESPAEFGSRLAREIDISLKGRGDPFEQIVAALRPRRTLLVLDNFEHLVEQGAALVERLLAECPQVKVVVTSRVRLALSREWLQPLEGLPCPEAEDRDHIETFDAARLFVRAARRVQPDLVPAAEAAAIVEICRLVEGLPLALELAASWTRVLSCAAIADELRRGTELLSAVDAARPSRHASLEVVFDQTWRLLTDIEREVLAKLSVFRGSFSPEAARSVTGAPLPVLAALADKSLLHKEQPRLHLHPLVQQLAAARLGDGAARMATQGAHAAHFHNLLVQLKPASEDGSRDALQVIDTEFENIRQAWQFAIAQAQTGALTHSVPTLLNYWENRARFAEGLELLRQTIESPLGRSEVRLQALMLSQASLLQVRLGRYAEAEEGAARALATTRATRDRDTRLRALSVLGSCALFTGRLLEAKRRYEQALELAEAARLAYDAAGTLENLALVEKRLGNYDEALRLSIDSLEQHRRNGDSASIALSLSNLGSLYMFMQRDAAAAVHLREALALSERDGLVSTLGFALANLTELSLKAKDIEQARAYAERALEVADATGMRALAGWLKVQLARMAAGRGELDAAHALLSAGSELALALGAPSLKAAALLGLAELLEAKGEIPSARRVLAFAKDQPSISAPDREELRVEWARRGETAEADGAWPALTLDELLQRVVIEGNLACAPLIATLRSAP
jgi:predicted ATPase/DNA-binding SARP family transcriptional activator